MKPYGSVRIETMPLRLFRWAITPFAEGSPLPRFFIDVHADSLSEWDDVGTVTDTADIAVALAKGKAQVMLAQSNQAQANPHAVAVIRDEMDASVATVVIRASEEPHVVWGTTRAAAGEHQG
ncbi:hypothetical protein FV218_06495 [Methylobacterium sp. WL69]|uniref:hypothetical protein n=1 Tax=Methylobacterium sp. WL69 TaxID=2603893 RepID=UPI0011C81C18|nr:hypothetical protein [Methylobacterium sp. WL69]TXM76592.1 hypothetical protein FV218_06495 [Methylobacterium sp. WL69]